MKSVRTITVRGVAERLDVSSATVRNWLKAGDITLTERSLRSMERKIERGDRLSSRANKLHKLAESSQLPPQSWEEYEESLSESHRNHEGVYYTPLSIVREMMEAVLGGENLEDKTFLDPCCGCGNFLAMALEMGFRAENIYGYDIDYRAVEFARERLAEGVNIECCDFLMDAPSISFDYIFTNPPWGKRIDAVSRKALSERYGTPLRVDTSVIFQSAIFEHIRKDGVVGMLMPESYFNIGAFEWGRSQLLRSTILYISDFGKPFKGLMTRAQGVIFRATPASDVDECECRYEGLTYRRMVSSFVRNPKSIINFWANDAEAKLIERIFTKEHITLEDGCRWGIGIVTGNNKQYCVKRQRDGYKPLTRGVDIKPNEIDKASIYLKIDLSACQQSAPRELYEAREKLIYRFISQRLTFAVDRERRYILNSANMLIIDKPLSVEGHEVGHEQIAQLLNSRVMNWLYAKLFRSHKILRKDLERLPLHIGYFAQHDEFDDDSYAQYLGL